MPMVYISSREKLKVIIMEKSIRDRIIDLFPLKGIITQAYIDDFKALNDNTNVFNCPGACALRAALRDNIDLTCGKEVCFGCKSTTLSPRIGSGIFISTEERLILHKVTEPMEVTFIVTSEYVY